MLRSNVTRNTVALLLLIATAVLLANCGGGSSGTSGSSSSSSSSGTSSGMTSAQREDFTNHATSLAIQSMNGASFAKPVYDAPLTDVAAKQALENKLLSSYSCNQAGCSIYQPFSYRWTCGSTGNTAITGNMSGNISSSGTGLIQIQLTQTITDNACYVAGLIFNGDPYLSLTGTFSFLNGQPSTTQRVTISGGFKWSGNSSGSCSMNVSTNFDRSGHGTTSGTVCGESVYYTF